MHTACALALHTDRIELWSLTHLIKLKFLIIFFLFVLTVLAIVPVASNA